MEAVHKKVEVVKTKEWRLSTTKEWRLSTTKKVEVVKTKKTEEVVNNKKVEVVNNKSGGCPNQISTTRPRSDSHASHPDQSAMIAENRISFSVRVRLRRATTTTKKLRERVIFRCV